MHPLPCGVRQWGVGVEPQTQTRETRPQKKTIKTGGPTPQSDHPGRLIYFNCILSLLPRFASVVFRQYPGTSALARCLYSSSESNIIMWRGWRSLKGTVSAQKALQGSETEMTKLMEGTRECNVPSHDLIDLPSISIGHSIRRFPPSMETRLNQPGQKKGGACKK